MVGICYDWKAKADSGARREVKGMRRPAAVQYSSSSATTCERESGELAL